MVNGLNDMIVKLVQSITTPPQQLEDRPDIYLKNLKPYLKLLEIKPELLRTMLSERLIDEIERLNLPTFWFQQDGHLTIYLLVTE